MLLEQMFINSDVSILDDINTKIESSKFKNICQEDNNRIEESKHPSSINTISSKDIFISVPSPQKVIFHLALVLNWLYDQ